jgi:rod shape-determining protein MreC
MENLLTRYRNVSILVGVLFAQVLGLAVQVRRADGDKSSPLIRVWAVRAVTPFEKAIVWMGNGSGNLWHEYAYLRGVRQENRDLKLEIEQLRLERARLTEDAEQARRLQKLLGFKETFIRKTVAAQVIGSSGSEQSRSIFIDKGSDDGIKPDTAVITADGVVGKVWHVFGSTSQVLLISDQSSGVGAILENSRAQGVLHGTPTGGVVVKEVMSDESVAPGEAFQTSGGDGIFPKGLPIGTVARINRTADAFLSIEVKPAADLGKLEEVLVIAEKEQRVPVVADQEPQRAADILARRLPSVPDKPADDTTPKPAGASGGDPTANPKPTLTPAVAKPPKPENAGGAGTGTQPPVKKPDAVRKPQSVIKVSGEPAPGANPEPKPESTDSPSQAGEDKPQ